MPSIQYIYVMNALEAFMLWMDVDIFQMLATSPLILTGAFGT